MEHSVAPATASRLPAPFPRSVDAHDHHPEYLLDQAKRRFTTSPMLTLSPAWGGWRSG